MDDASGTDDAIGASMPTKLDGPAVAVNALAPSNGLGPIDLAALDRLRGVLGPAIEQALQPFFEDIPVQLDALAAAVEAQDDEAGKATASVIRGSASLLGATVLASLAKTALDLAADGRVHEIRPMVPDLRQAFEAAAGVLRQRTRRANGRREAEPPLFVLVVDDDRSTCRAIRFALQRSGFRVEEAGNGQQALELLQRMTPDAIVLDAVMPVIDGFTTCERIKADPRWSAIPVLMITALDDPSAGKRCYAAGAGDYIPKPVDFAILPQRLHGVVASQRSERRTRRLAYNDGVTGLPNRALFIEQLGRHIEAVRQSAQHLAVLSLSIERFDAVVAVLPQAAQDRLLCAVAERLQTVVPNAMSLARLDNADFAVALGMSSVALASATALDISSALAEPLVLQEQEVCLKAHVGISLYPDDAGDVSSLMQHAHAAMRDARTRIGLPFCYFDEGVEGRLAMRSLLEVELPYAVERHQLVVHYQPVARLDTGEFETVEALMRWHHPVHGLMLPAEFMAHAENTGVIVPAGAWVLMTACNQAAHWVNRGLRLRVGVNVSAQQVLDKSFCDRVAAALDQAGLPAPALELEFRESTLIAAQREAGELMARLRELGVRLCIDDFGTGQGSLQCLARFPVDSIKVPSDLLRIPAHEGRPHVLHGIVALARAMGIVVAVKGVEDAATLGGLHSSGVHLVQGRVIGEPMAAVDFERQAGLADPAAAQPAPSA